MDIDEPTASYAKRATVCVEAQDVDPDPVGGVQDAFESPHGEGLGRVSPKEQEIDEHVGIHRQRGVERGLREAEHLHRHLHPVTQQLVPGPVLLRSHVQPTASLDGFEERLGARIVGIVRQLTRNRHHLVTYRHRAVPCDVRIGIG